MRLIANFAKDPFALLIVKGSKLCMLDDKETEK